MLKQMAEWLFRSISPRYFLMLVIWAALTPCLKERMLKRLSSWDSLFRINLHHFWEKIKPIRSHDLNHLLKLRHLLFSSFFEQCWGSFNEVWMAFIYSCEIDLCPLWQFYSYVFLVVELLHTRILTSTAKLENLEQLLNLILSIEEWLTHKHFIDYATNRPDVNFKRINILPEKHLWRTIPQPAGLSPRSLTLFWIFWCVRDMWMKNNTRKWKIS